MEGYHCNIKFYHEAKWGSYCICQQEKEELEQEGEELKQEEKLKLEQQGKELELEELKVG